MKAQRSAAVRARVASVGEDQLPAAFVLIEPGGFARRGQRHRRRPIQLPGRFPEHVQSVRFRHQRVDIRSLVGQHRDGHQAVLEQERAKTLQVDFTAGAVGRHTRLTQSPWEAAPDSARPPRRRCSTPSPGSEGRSQYPSRSAGSGPQGSCEDTTGRSPRAKNSVYGQFGAAAPNWRVAATVSPVFQACGTHEIPRSAAMLAHRIASVSPPTRPTSGWITSAWPWSINSRNSCRVCRNSPAATGVVVASASRARPSRSSVCSGVSTKNSLSSSIRRSTQRASFQFFQR